MREARQRCGRCQRPVSHCLCSFISVVPNRTRVLVLQHPDESRHPLNTGRLAVLGLSQADLWVGDYFDHLGACIAAARSACVLFPSPAADELPTSGAVTQPDLLIVPDGTWRKARQIMRANPVLATVPHISLPAGQPSRYRVRKAREPAAVSTIEAVVRTLAVLEPEQDFEPVLHPFERMVAMQLDAMSRVLGKER